MKDLAVVYATKYGHTKQYADWMKEEAGADIFVSTSFTPTKALEYKAVVFAGGVYGDKILIMDWLKKKSRSGQCQQDNHRRSFMVLQ